MSAVNWIGDRSDCTNLSCDDDSELVGNPKGAERSDLRGIGRSLRLSHERPAECKGGGFADGGEDGSESAASLIQSVTVHIFQSGPLPRVPVVVQHVGNSDIGLAIFIAVL
jgi:hypothetical protein